MTLQCKADNWWEYCTWKHENWKCDHEWKYNSGNVEIQDCPGLEHRAKFVGKYKEHECDIRLTGVTEADAGLWVCTLEEYISGWPR